MLSELGDPQSSVKTFVAAKENVAKEPPPPQHPPTLNQCEVVSAEPQGSQPDGSLASAPVDCGALLDPVRNTPGPKRAPSVVDETVPRLLRVIVSADARPAAKPIDATRTDNPTRTVFKVRCSRLVRSNMTAFSPHEYLVNTLIPICAGSAAITSFA